jgi:ribosomal protein S18 acetylase RimI-like enzyme
VDPEVVTIDRGPDREAWVPLLQLADEPGPLRRALRHGDLYGIADGKTGRPRAAVLVTDEQDGAAELRVVAVAEADQGSGLGSWLVAHVCQRLRTSGIRRAVVGTGNSGMRQLAFYQRLGFRLERIERDAFTPARGYPADLSENGIPTRDMVWMERSL